MTFSVILRPDAASDAVDAYHDLTARSPGLGDRFDREVGEVVRRLTLWPEMYGLFWRDVRAAKLATLNYIVFYLIAGDRVEVIAIRHGSMDAAGWQSRLDD